MRRTDVPTQRRPRRRQVSQGMRVGNGRTAADAFGFGVGAIVILHESPGPSIAYLLPTDRMKNETPQSKMLQVEHPPGRVRHRRGTSASGGPNNPSPTVIPDLGVGPLMLSKIRLGREALEVRAGGHTRPSRLTSHPRPPYTVIPSSKCPHPSGFSLQASINQNGYEFNQLSIMFNQVQSTINQPQSIDNQEQSLFNHNLDPHPYIHPLPPHPPIPDNGPQAAALMHILGGETL